jgi:hypothetical protein
MQTTKVEGKRQTYRVILQLMTYISIMALLGVMFSSAFVGNNTETEINNRLDGIIKIPLQSLSRGELMHVLWQGKRVSILHRNDVKEKTYLVYYDLGDSGNCPLYFNGKLLKDICTATQYRQSGVALNKNRTNSLGFPPHYFATNQQQLIIGLSKSQSIK